MENATVQSIMKKRMKKGITLIEIILAIVLIAIILGITIPKLMSNSQKSEIKQTVSSDVKSIVEAITLWRKQSSVAQGNYQSLSANEIFSMLPSNMVVDRTRGIIYSSGMKTGQAGLDGTANVDTAIRYTVTWRFDNTQTDTGRFAIGIDAANGQNVLDWDEKTTLYALESFRDIMVDLSTDGNVPTTFNTAAPQTTGTNAIAFPCNVGTASCFHGISVR